MTSSADAAPDSLQFVERVKHNLAEEVGLAGSAAEQLRLVNVELIALMSARAERNWTSAEFERYLVLSRSERSCELSYAMARRRFDVLRWKLASTEQKERS